MIASSEAIFSTTSAQWLCSMTHAPDPRPWVFTATLLVRCAIVAGQITLSRCTFLPYTKVAEAGSGSNRPESDMSYSTYTVTVTPKLETWNNKQYTVEMEAKSRADAIKQAREQYKENAQDFGQTAATYTAKKND